MGQDLPLTAFFFAVILQGLSELLQHDFLSQFSFLIQVLHFSQPLHLAHLPSLLHFAASGHLHFSLQQAILGQVALVSTAFVSGATILQTPPSQFTLEGFSVTLLSAAIEKLTVRQRTNAQIKLRNDSFIIYTSFMVIT